MKEMYNLYELATIALDNLNAIGIYPHLTASDFSINNRAKSRYGQAKRRCKNGVVTYSVNISAFLLDKRNDERSVMTTIYHEAIHCCDNCMCHTGKWKELAELVSDCYNVDVTRCSSFEDRLNEDVLREKTEKETKNKKAYRWQCSACGKMVAKIGNRAPKWYMNPKGYYHNNCPCAHHPQILSEYYGFKEPKAGTLIYK